MKTTLDLPDSLMHAVKIRAVNERRKLKDLIAELLQQGLREKPADAAKAKNAARNLPISSARGGLQSRVKLNDSRALLRHMEG